LQAVFLNFPPGVQFSIMGDKVFVNANLPDPEKLLILERVVDNYASSHVCAVQFG
jgi:hypothetical protein